MVAVTGAVTGKGGQINGDKRLFYFGWCAHNAIYRSCIIVIYTWNLHDSINQCHTNKYN